MILNLKKLNKFIPDIHFKMDHFPDFLNLLHTGDFMAKLDLVEAFHSLKIKQKFWKYLQFEFEGQKYMFITAPQGMKLSPYYFVKVTKPLITHCRERGIRLIIYIDDIIVIGRHYESCLANLLYVKNLFECCGYTINMTKSVFIPSQLCEVLGFMVDSVSMHAYLPEDKRLNYIQFFEQCLQIGQITTKKLAKLIGIAISCCVIFPKGKLHYRDMEWLKLKSLQASQGNWLSLVELDHNSIIEIRWWLDMFNKNPPTPFTSTKPWIECTSDASTTGWGFTVDNDYTGMAFDPEMARKHINDLELVAVLYGIQSFKHRLRNKHINLACDNTTCIADLKNMGTLVSEFRNNIVRHIYRELESLNSDLTIRYIASADNKVADWASRNMSSHHTEWSLCPTIFKTIIPLFKQCNFDLFASHVNAKFPAFCSWHPNPGASHVDAFTLDWNLHRCYAFPPFRLLPRCLSYIRNHRVKDITFLVPYMPGQIWFPDLLQLVVCPPLVLPKVVSQHLMNSVDRARYPVPLHLVLVRLSTDALERKAFHKMCQDSLHLDGQKTHVETMTGMWKIGSGLITEGVPILTVLVSIKCATTSCECQ